MAGPMQAATMSRRFWRRWHQLGGWRQRQRARRQQLRQRQREQQRALWGGPVEADRVLAFSDAVFAIAITLLTLNLQVPAGLQGADLTRALHQVLPALGLQRLIWLDVTRSEHWELLREPVPDEVRTGFDRVLLGLLVVFGAAVPVGMFAPRYATRHRRRTPPPSSVLEPSRSPPPCGGFGRAAGPAQGTKTMRRSLPTSDHACSTLASGTGSMSTLISPAATSWSRSR